MGLVDWRALYASNRAVIEGRRPQEPMPMPGGGGVMTAARPALPAAAAPPGPATSPSLERLEHRGDRGTRAIHVHVPPDLDPATAAPLVVALHGCTQTPATFAAGSLLNRVADRHGFLVAYPEQTREENPQGCWNWFAAAHQARGGGEPASIAGATRVVMDARARWTVDERRVFVAGMSAGGAMATVLAATHPDLFAAVAVHSGLPYGCARGLPAATQAMTRGAADPEALGAAAFAAMGAHARPVPALVIHGTADRVVSPVNGEHVVRQWLVTNRRAAGDGQPADHGHPDATVRGDAGGRTFTRRTWTDAAGDAIVEHVEVDGLGHAWSGGAPGGSYTDPRGPAAAEVIWDFLARAGG